MIDPDIHHTESADVLEVTLERSVTRCRLVLRGTLFATTIAALEAQIDQLGCTPCHEVVVDMEGLLEMDQVGANVILGLYHYVVGRGGQLQVQRPTVQIATTLDPVIPVIGSLPTTALSDGQPSRVAPSTSSTDP